MIKKFYFYINKNLIKMETQQIPEKISKFIDIDDYKSVISPDL